MNDKTFSLKKLVSECDFSSLSALDSLNVKSDTGQNLLMYFITKEGRCDDVSKFIDLFLSKGIDLEDKNIEGLSALHFSVAYCQLSVCEYLIKKGITIDIVDNDGNTPLMTAFRDYRGEAIKKNVINVLISNGADLDCKNNYGVSPRTMAVQLGEEIDEGINPRDWDLREFL